MSDDLNIAGGRELDAFLQSLSTKVETNIMRSALRAGANVIKAEAKANVPVHMGALQKSVRVTTRVKSGSVVVSVKAGSKEAWYWRFVEFGTARHWIKVTEGERPWRNTRKGAKAYSIKTLNKMAGRGSLIIGTHFVGNAIVHPGATPKPFMRPALDSKSAAALEAVAEQIRKRLTAEGINTPAPEMD